MGVNRVSLKNLKYHGLQKSNFLSSQLKFKTQFSDCEALINFVQRQCF